MVGLLSFDSFNEWKNEPVEEGSEENCSGDCCTSNPSHFSLHYRPLQRFVFQIGVESIWNL